MGDFTGMHTKPMKQRASDQVPKTHSKINPARYQKVSIVSENLKLILQMQNAPRDYASSLPGMFSMRMQQTIDSAMVTGKNLVRRPI